MAREWYSRPINSGYTVVDGTTTGNYNNGVPNTYVKTWMEYLVIQNDTDKANNRSRIDVKLYSQVIDGGSSTGMSSATTANNYGYVGYDNANQQYLNTTYNFNNFALNKFADATLTIPHNADGTKTITLQGVFQTLSGTWAITGGSVSANITLPAIDMYKPTIMASFTGQNYGYQSTLILERQASNLRENVTLSYGGTTLNLKNTSSSATTITFTVDRQYTPNTAYPSASDWTLTITTYNGSTLIGTMTYTKQFTIRSDDTSYKPTLTAQPTAQAYNDVISALGTDTIVLGYSKLRVYANKSNISLKYGASISQRYVRFGGRYNVSGINNTYYESNLIENGNDTVWSYVVVDSRGFQADVVTGSFGYTTVSAPTIDIQECYRGLSNQSASESGTYIWVKAVTSYSYAGGHNSCTLKAQVAGFSQVTLTSGTRTAIVSSASAQNAYQITFTATDLFNTTENTRTIPSEDVPIHIREGGKGVGIGAYSGGEGLVNIGYQLGGDFKAKGDRVFASVNLLDKGLIESGGISDSNGADETWSKRIRTAQYIKVSASTAYTCSSTQQVAKIYFYNSSKTFLSCSPSVVSQSTYTFTTPSGCAYVRIAFKNSGNTDITPSDISNVMLEKGNSASSFVQYTMDGIEVADTLRTLRFEQLNFRDKIVATRNLLDVSAIMQGSTYGIDRVSASNNRVSSTKCKVLPNTPYYIQSTSSTAYIETITFFNSSGSVLSYKTDLYSGSGNFTTPSNCYYVRFQWLNPNGNLTPSGVTSAQLERGSTPTSIVPFTLDGEQVAERLREKEWYVTQQITAPTSFSDTGVSLTLAEKGFYIIHAQGVANRSGIDQIALIYQYGTGSSRGQLASQSSVLQQSRLIASFSGFIDTNNATITVWAKYGGATQNTISIFAKRLYTELINN